ncbi:hypothetical protein MHM84_01245 [Halomonas sp. McH1-25]|uniref:hypothetical protein n=1 Tax=unclassified Halomonas TaxID=2609666 RepID=UPI001EF6C49A|nr:MULTISPECIES: hypothetical protein [unclassified Halomonas]MCG7598407.1 hypothetical protein [Halomonas sp. McH1-25]MCP1342651.1 hypothetical protein [Halomonas sp. FL8]MCP1361722.1 hypothetical protein [Halomonas sp. BBD45]MCP1363818.1 hypothetical protein [Halomonas sp. BBD48]
MANSYYDNSDPGQRFQPGTTAEAEAVEAKFDAVATGFDSVEEDTDRALKLPAEAGVSQEIAATALQRRNKVVGFDAEGKLALMAGFTWRGDWVAGTEYFVNDVVRDPATRNWYIATARHTSGTTFATTNWALGLDYTAVKALLRTEVGDLVEADLQPLVTAADDDAKAADASRIRAQEWAEKEGEVLPGLRSAKYWAGVAEQKVTGNTPVTSLKPGTLAAEKDYVSTDGAGSLVTRNLVADFRAQLTAGNEVAKLSRYDTASATATTTLDLAQQQVFRVDASVARTLELINLPPAGRSMVVKIKVTGPGPITWVTPVPIQWDDGKPLVLGDVATRVLLDIDNEEITGFGKELA